MIRMAYVIGQAGAGKSTFTEQLMSQIVMFSDQVQSDLLSQRNAKALVTLRGHKLVAYDGAEGWYLGALRQNFPGTDGLDRASSPVGAEWLASKPGIDFVLAEGATLATKPFLMSAAIHTELIVVHLTVDTETASRRFARRGSTQDPKFVLNTCTRSRNLAAFMKTLGVRVLSIDTTDSEAWDTAVDLVALHLNPEKETNR